LNWVIVCFYFRYVYHYCLLPVYIFPYLKIALIDLFVWLFIQGRWLNSSFVNQCHLNLWPIENSKYSETCLNWTLQKLEFCINCIKNMSQYYILGNLVNKHFISRQSCILSLSNLQTLDYIFCAVDPPRVKGQRRKRKVNIYVKCCVQFVDPFSFILYCVVLFIVVDIDAQSLWKQCN
jgi:hypothetical protein